MHQRVFTALVCLLLVWSMAADSSSAGLDDGVAYQEILRQKILRFDRELQSVAVGLDLPGQERATDERLDRLARNLRALEKLTCPAGACVEPLEQKRRRLLDFAEAVERGARPSEPKAEKRAAGTCAQAEPIGLGESVRGSEQASSFFRFKAPADGSYVVDSFGSRGDSRLTVYRRCGGEVMAANDDTRGLAARVAVDLRQGESVWVELAGVGGLPVAEVLGGGSISGTLRDTSGEPIAGVEMALLQPSGGFFGFATTAADGSYSFSALDAGTYIVRSNYLYGSYYSHGAWQDVICGQVCSVQEATPIPLAEGQHVTGIDLSLPEGGEITGRVRLTGSVDPVAGAEVTVYDSAGSYVNQSFTDVSGRYRLRGLSPGDYYVRARHDELGSEMWQDRPCDGSCNVLGSDAITVDYDVQVSGIDFQLDARGAIEVRLTDPQTGEQVFADDLYVYDSDGELVASSYSSQRVGGLSSGTYFLLVRDYSFLDFVWSGLACEWSPCDPTAGTPLEVVEGETILLEGEVQANGAVSGTVSAGVGGDPLEGNVFLYTQDGDYADSGWAYDGSYVLDIAPGDFRAYADDYGFLREAWDGVPCDEDCGVVGDLITVTGGTETGDIDFSLTRLGSLSGRVTDAATGIGVPNLRLELYDKDGNYYASRGGGADGEYTFTNLPAGDYFVIAEQSAYDDELWDDVPCESGCVVMTGTPINVQLESETTGIDFSLVRQPFLDGTIREEGSGQLITNAGVLLYDASGNYVAGTTTYDGHFVLNSLAEGTYYAVARGDDEHVDVLWNGQTCFLGVDHGGCDPLDGEAIVVDADGVTIDFVLPVGGAISGTASGVTDGSDIAYGSVYVFTAGGQLVDSASVDDDGAWRVPGLDTGDYVAMSSFSAYFDQLWNGLPCETSDFTFPACDVTAGTPIAVTIGAEVQGVDFALDRLGRIRGSVRTADDEKFNFGSVALYDASGAFVGSDFFTSASSASFVFDTLLPGVYYLATSDFAAYHDRVYGGESCEPGPCDPTTGTPISVALDATAGPFELVLEPGPGFDISVRSHAGSPIAGASIDIWHENGNWIKAVLTGADGRAVTGLAAGTYLLSTDNGQGLVDELWQDVVCPDGPAYLDLCDLDAATPVMLTAPAVTAMDFVLEDPGVLFFDGFESGSTSSWTSAVP